MRWKTLGRVLLLTLAGLMLLTVLLLGALRIAFERAPHYQAEIKSWLYRQTGYPLEFTRVLPSFHWSGPDLYLERPELRSRDGRRVIARAARGRVGADLWQLLHGGRLFALRIELDEPDIVLTRTGPRTFSLANEIEIGGAPPSVRALRDWPDGTISIRRGRMTIEGWNAALPSLVLSSVNLDVRHGADVLALSAAARLPAVLGGTLRMNGTAQGRGTAASLDWAGVLSARDISFAGWKQLLPRYLTRLDAGNGAFSLAVSGRGAALGHADLSFDAHHVTAQLSDEPESRFDQVSGALTLDHSADRWVMRGRHLQAIVPGRRDPESELDVDWRASEAGLLTLEARANYLRAETLLPLAGLFPQPELRARLSDIAPTGEWMDMRIHLARALTTDPWQLAVQARFRDVGFAPVGLAPGLRGLSGSLAGDQSGGHVQIDGPNAVFFWPGQFPEPLTLSNLKTTLYWKRTTEQFLVATPSVSFGTHGASAQAKVAWSSPEDGSSPVLTIAGRVQGGQASDARLFFPHRNLPPAVLAWLDRAFVKGRLAHADIAFAGPVRHFPFRDGSGLFVVRALLEGMTLDYHEHWPVIEDGAALAEFRNQGMDIKISSARAAGLTVESGEARFLDFKTGELEVHAQAHGDADGALDFLRTSPLDAMAEHGFSATAAHGPLHVNLNLFLPFREFDHRRVLVRLDLQGDTVARAGSSIAASEVTGEADIEGAQVVHADVHGRLLGGPFQMTARPPRNRPRTALEFRGTLAGDALRSALSIPPSVHIGGDTDWRAVLRMTPSEGRERGERSLRVTSNLAGLQIDLPLPLKKAAGSAWPATLDAQWPLGSSLQLRLSLDSVLQAAASLESDPEGWRLVRAAVAWGSGEPVFNDTQLVNVAGRVERLDLAGWMRLASMPQDAKPLPNYLTSAALDVRELDYLGFAFHDVALNLAASDGGWRVAVSGPSAAGVILLPTDPAAPLSLQFERLKLRSDRPEADGPGDSAAGTSDAPTAARASMDPRGLPAINLRVGDLSWGDRQLGEARATLVQVEDGVELKALSLAGASFTLGATGDWRTRDGGRAHLQGRMQSSDVAATMKELGFAPAMEAKSGAVDFDLSWLGAPSLGSLQSATGGLKIAFDNGQIVKLDPGAGRVIGLASLAELPRRLEFDFSDLTDKGFAFNTIRGSFRLKDGSAYTDDVLVRGPAAEIGLVGRVGLKSKDYDQTAVVTGNVGNSPLPFAAFAGGPVVGAAVVLFTQVFKQPLKGLVRGYYRITGSWDNPTVERIRSANAAQATTEGPK